MVFCILYLYNTLILNFEDVTVLNMADWIFATEPATMATVSTWLASNMVGNLMISGILVWFLVCQPMLLHTPMTNYRQHKTGFKKSDQMVDRIIRVTMQTGLLTMIFAALDLIFFLANPGGLFIQIIISIMHLLFNFPLSKLYTNSLLSSLNSRQGSNYNTPNRSHYDSESGHANTSSGTQLGGVGKKVGAQSKTPEYHTEMSI
ncbi:hypothetical protein B0H34DRAFT_670814 [Crassisporium funariophilum]|nr:hypothetical protein B0H34DRAFT_670814 [Crassisporium funariophilum]